MPAEEKKAAGGHVRGDSGTDMGGGEERSRSVGKKSVFEGVQPGELGVLPPSVARRLAKKPATEGLRLLGGGGI
jgi:hypothetical protein